MIGKTISHYKILEKLGGGGMGVVYKAQDTKLKRTVALKFLPSDLTRDDEAKERFMLEAQAASALDHSNICTIHEIDETEEGQLFIVMACYEGENLKLKLLSGPSVECAVDISMQVAQGLAKAHEQGIVHRDIKPANIMVTKDDVVKIVDFGLAKLTGATHITKTGTTMGTVAYMSPEQTRGEAVDHRTDIWSLGVVLYEMVSGRRPFRGEYIPAVMYSIAHEEPEPISALRTEVPAHLERIVSKALAKAQDERYQSMLEMLSDLGSFKKEIESGVIEETASKKKSVPSIAVLPFMDMSPKRDQEYFCDGMAEELIDALTKIEGLQVVSRSSAFQFKQESPDIRQVGKKLNVNHVLEGSVRKAGKRLRITAQLINVEDGYHLWSDKYDRESEDVFAIQDDIASTIVNLLKIKLVGGQEAPLVKRHTEDLEAYNLYLKGRYFWNRRYEGGLQKGIECFQKAIEKDSNYALPYAGLADSFISLAHYNYLSPKEAFSKGKAAATKSLELDNLLAEAHTSLANIKVFYDWDWLAGEREFKRAIELNPSYANAHLWYSVYLMVMDKVEESLAEIRRAMELEPLSLIINTSAGWMLYYARRYDQAIEECEKVIEMDPNFGVAHAFVADPYLQKKRFIEAITERQKAMNLMGDLPALVGFLGHIYAVSGKRQQAQKILKELNEVSKVKYVSSYIMAIIYLGLGKKDKAFELLDQAIEERDWWLCFLKVDPRLDSLRSDPRFTELLKKLGLAA